jgi:hypothetical protein
MDVEAEVKAALRAMERERARLAFAVDGIRANKKKHDQLFETLREARHELETVQKLIHLKNKKEKE